MSIRKQHSTNPHPRPAYNKNDDLDEYSNNSMSEDPSESSHKRSMAINMVKNKYIDPSTNAGVNASVAGAGTSNNNTRTDDHSKKIEKLSNALKDIPKKAYSVNILCNEDGKMIEYPEKNVLPKLKKDPLWGAISDNLLQLSNLSKEEIEAIGCHSYYGKEYFDLFIKHISNLIYTRFDDCPEMKVVIRNEKSSFHYSLEDTDLTYQSIFYIEFLGDSSPPLQWNYVFKREAPYVDIIPCSRKFKPCCNEEHSPPPPPPPNKNIKFNDSRLEKKCSCKETFQEDKNDSNSVFICGEERKNQKDDDMMNEIYCYKIIINFIAIEKHPDNYDSTFITTTTTTADNINNNGINPNDEDEEQTNILPSSSSKTLGQRDMATAARNSLTHSSSSIMTGIEKQHQQQQAMISNNNLQSTTPKKKRKRKEKKPTQQQNKRKKTQHDSPITSNVKQNDNDFTLEMLSLNDINEYANNIMTIYKQKPAKRSYNANAPIGRVNVWLHQFIKDAFYKFSLTASNPGDASWTKESTQNWQNHCFTKAFKEYTNQIIEQLKNENKSAKGEYNLLAMQKVINDNTDNITLHKQQIQKLLTRTIHLESLVTFFKTLMKHRVTFEKISRKQLCEDMENAKTKNIKFQFKINQNDPTVGKFTNAIIGTPFTADKSPDGSEDNVMLIVHYRNPSKRKNTQQQPQQPMKIVTGIIRDNKSDPQLAECLRKTLQFVNIMRMKSRSDEFISLPLGEMDKHIEQEIKEFNRNFCTMNNTLKRFIIKPQ